jgi:tape measure domain-containing protein
MDGKIGFILTADDNHLMIQMSVSGQKAGQKLGSTIHNTATREMDKGFKGFKLSETIFQGMGQGVGQKLAGGIMAGVAGAIGGVGALIGDSIKVGGEFEKTEIAFGTMLGSATKAKEMLASITKFSAETPFELPGVTNAAKQLLAFGIDADKVMGTLKTVGDVAAGVSAPIEDIAGIIGKIKADGRLDAGTLGELSGRGVPMIAALAAQYGVAESQVRKLVESGVVGFPEVSKAFEAMTGAGGKFNNLMAAQSQTVSGKISTLNDQFTLLKLKIFDAFKPATSGIVDLLGEVFSGLQGNDAAFAGVNKQAQAFGDELKAHPEYAAALKQAVTDLTEQGLNLAIDGARSLTEYLKENPTAIKDGIDNLKGFLTMLQQIVGVLGLAIEGWKEIGTLIKGAENVGAEGMLNSAQKKVVEARMKQKQEQGVDIGDGYKRPLLAGSMYDNEYQKTVNDVLVETANAKRKQQEQDKFKLKPGEIYGPVQQEAIGPQQQKVVKPPESKEDNALRIKQNTEIRKAQAEYRQAILKSKKDRYQQGSTERINLEEQIELGDVRDKHSEKVAALRTELAQYVKDKQKKIKKGEKGGIDYTAAIERTRKLITAEQNILNTELGDTRTKFSQQRLASTRETTKATTVDKERLREGRSAAATTKLASTEAAAAPGSLKGQEIRYKIDVAGINEKYDKSKVDGQAQLTELRQKQADKVKSGQTSGYDYTAAIGRQQELMRLQEQSRTAELAGLQYRRRWELRQQQDTRDEQKRGSVRGMDKAETQSQQNISQARSQIQEATAGDSIAKRKIGYQSEIQQTNFKYDNTQRDTRQQIQDLEVKRKNKVDFNLSDGVDYSAEIAAKQKLISENETLRQSELQLLKIKQQQQEVVAQREAEDRKTAAARSRRDSNEQTANQKRLSELQRKKSTTNDPIAVVAIDKEISEFSLNADQSNSATQYKDKLTDLRTGQRRQQQNKQMGISDPALETVDFGAEIAAVESQAAATTGKFNQEKSNLNASFQQTINEKYKEERNQLIDQAHTLRMETLRTQLDNTKDERVKVGIQLEIDQAGITQQYDVALRDLDKLLKQMGERKDKFIAAKLPTDGIDAMIKELNDIRKGTVAQKTNATASRNAKVPFETAAAEAAQTRKEVSAIALTKSPVLAATQAEASQLMVRGKFAESAAVGRQAAIGEEQLRYNDQRASLKEQVAQTQASGIQIPIEELNQMNDAVEKLHNINLSNIKTQFDELTAAISASNLQLMEMGQGASTDFFQKIISGTATVDDAFKGMVRSMINGIAQIIAQNLAAQMFGSAQSGDKNQGGASSALGFVGKLLGFSDGNEVPGDNRFQSMRQGNSPIAHALRKEGSDAIIAALTPGERVLNLQETAAYHERFPAGILNYNTGGIAGEMGNIHSIMPAGSAAAVVGGGNMEGNFNFNFDHKGADDKNNGFDQLNAKLEGAVRKVMIDESRSGGILNRYR